MKTARYSARLAAFLACLALAALAQAGGKVKVGYCGPLKDIDAVKAAGFDYMEVRTSEVAALTDSEFEALAAKFKQIGLPVLREFPRQSAGDPQPEVEVVGSGVVLQDAQNLAELFLHVTQVAADRGAGELLILRRPADFDLLQHLVFVAAEGEQGDGEFADEEVALR